jgi:hypothetical protein
MKFKFYLRFRSLTAMHTSNSDSCLLFSRKGHQFRLGSDITTSNEFLGCKDSFISKCHEFAGINFTDVMRLHVVGKEVFS